VRAINSVTLGRAGGERPERGLPAVSAPRLGYRRFGAGVFPVARLFARGVRGIGRLRSNPSASRQRAKFGSRGAIGQQPKPA